MRPVADGVVFLVALEVDPLADHFRFENVSGGQVVPAAPQVAEFQIHHFDLIIDHVVLGWFESLEQAACGWFIFSTIRLFLIGGGEGKTKNVKRKT
jgi:hypothetical protein